MENRPNIFTYATRELTQDAVVCWLLACCHSENEKYRQSGLDFVRFVLGNEYPEITDIEIDIESPHKQYYHMDVYANVRVGDRIIPVIFENKTNTYLHGQQHIRYCSMVKDWKTDTKWKNKLFNDENLTWDKTLFVFFKTGYMFNWQKAELEQAKEELAKHDAILKVMSGQDMLEFVNGRKDQDVILSDYYAFLEDKISQLKNCKEERFERCFEKIFGKNKWFKYDYQGWASRDILYLDMNDNQENNRIYYSLRMSTWQNKEGIAFQQYRNEKNLVGSQNRKEELKAERNRLIELTREICREIMDEMNVDILIEENDKNKIPHQNNIFKLFVSDIGEDELCRFFRDFIERFKEKFKENGIVYNVADF